MKVMSITTRTWT